MNQSDSFGHLRSIWNQFYKEKKEWDSTFFRSAVRLQFDAPNLALFLPFLSVLTFSELQVINNKCEQFDIFITFYMVVFIFPTNSVSDPCLETPHRQKMCPLCPNRVFSFAFLYFILSVFLLEPSNVTFNVVFTEPLLIKYWQKMALKLENFGNEIRKQAVTYIL